MSKKLICPECGSPLAVESCYKYGPYIMEICWCENCNIDWDFQYSKENGYVAVEKVL